MNDKDKNKKIKQLEKENERLKKVLAEEKQKNKHYDAWEFHWDGRGSYEESIRGFYGDFS